MTELDKIASLVTESGLILHIGERTAAMIAEVYDWRGDLDDLDACKKGQLVIDFAGSAIQSNLRKHSEGRKIE